MPEEIILIAEDQQLAATYIRSGLEKLGYSIAETVSTGEEAIRTAEERKPDLVLMDIHLRGEMDGIEAAKKIRFGSNIPVIFITGYKDDRLLEQSKVAEPLGFVMKPFSLRELQSTIETGLNYYHSTLKRNREALHSLELRYRDLFENAIQGIFRVSKSGKYVDANASFAGLLGYDSPKELLDFAADAGDHYVYPERYRELLRTLKTSGFVRDFEFEAYRKDGTRVWLAQNTRLVVDPGSGETYFEGIAHDISERKFAEKSLRSLLARQAALLAAVPDIIVEIDLNRVYTWANTAGFEFFGDDVIGKEAACYFEGEQSPFFAVDPLWEGQKDSVNFRSWQRRKDGQKRLLAWRCQALKDHRGKVIGALSSARDITDSTQAEKALHQSEERFRLITEHIDEVFWIAEVESSRVTFVSPAFERICGFPGEKLYESKEFFRNALHPEDRERVVSTFAMEFEGQPIELEYRIIRSDGSIRHILDRGFPIPDGSGHVTHYVGVAKDVTARRQAEESLKKSKEYLNQIINCIGDPIFAKDNQDRFLLVNDAMCAFAGKRREEIVGKTTHQILPEGQADLILKRENSLREKDQKCIFEEEVTGSGGHTRTVMTNKSLLIDNDGNKQIIGVMRDVTEMKKAEKERANMEIQLRQAQKLEAIGQLAAGIAHEINTPTQYVSDNTRFLKDAYLEMSKVLQAYDRLLQANREGPVDPALIANVEAVIADADLEYLIEEAPKAITQSLEGLERVATIVRAMKEFSHPSSEEKQTVDLNHAIENTVTVCRNEWKYVAEMTLDLDTSLPLVPCLPGDFNQVILNLIVNAAHAIAEATAGNEKQKGTISISTRHDGDHVEIRIGDTGTGIPEEHRAKIFTPFFTTKEVGKGTGQGLAISHSVIVGKHGGTIDFETELGKGTVFIIRLPMHPDSIQ